MRSLILVAAMAAFATLAIAQSPPQQSTSDMQTVTVTAASKRIQIPSKIYRPYPGEFQHWRGAYSLSSGHTMTLSTRGERMFASVGKSQRMELVAASPDEFVAKNEQLKISFVHEPDNFDEVGGEVLMADTLAVN